MSDLLEVEEKTLKGDEWRGDITVVQDGEERTLKVRQLHDPEFFKVMKLIDRDELKDLRESLPEDKMEEYHDLQEKEELDSDEIERLEELEEELNSQSVSLFEVLSESTFDGIVKAGEYGVEPDQEDLRTALRTRSEEIEKEYGVVPRSDTDDVVYEYVKEKVIKDRILGRATNFQSFVIGMSVLVETVGEEGN